jgi:3-oxoacyl-[acyl-carrier-protein] synthase II
MMARENDVAVTGLGLVTPAGIGVEANWVRVLDARPTASVDPELAGLPVDISCRVPDFDAEAMLGRRTAWRLDRSTQLALVAARQAVADAGLDPGTWSGARVGVVLGCATGGTATFERAQRNLVTEGPDRVSALMVPMFSVNMVSGYVAIDCGAHGPNLVTATACASGATAIGTARDLLRTGACDVVITGGVEACLSPTVVSAFANMKALSRGGAGPAAASRPFDAKRDGFVMGEGAAVLVLERVSDARARGARVHARVAGYGASADAFHATSPEPNGAGAERAVSAALADAGVLRDEVDHVNAHATSTPIGDLAEARMLRRVFGDGPVVTSTKGVTGHTIGAAGAIEAAYTVLAVREGSIPPTANLDSLDPEIDLDVVTGAPRRRRVEVAVSDSFGFGGQNAVLVITS